MKTCDLNKLSLPVLIKIQEELPKAINKARKAEKSNLRKKIKALASESGFTLEELVGKGKASPKKRGKVKPKYENPDNAAQTWTGRGRMPLWVQDHLDNGGTKNDLLI